MKVSVIIIVKDTREYLPKCLDSIRNQSMRDFEVLVIDDASAVKSEDIVARYQETLDITYCYLPSSRGPGGARNYGLQHSSGEYLCFLDSDDWVDLDYLRKAESSMSQHQADIGMCGLVRNYDIESYQPLYKCRYDTTHTIDGITAFRMLAGQYDYHVVVSPSPVNKLYRRSLLEQNGILFLEHVFYEDVLFAFQTLLTGCKVITIPDVYYHHYRRAGSIVQSLTKRHFDDFDTVFTEVKAFLIRQGLYEEFGFHYYKILERFYSLLIRQVFQFSKSEREKKDWMKYSFQSLKKLVVAEEYMEYFSAEDIRRHIQPFLEDTSLR